jgi:hypothetical protein
MHASARPPAVASYVLLLLLQNLVFDHLPVNLKRKYKAEWALVTGASSGLFPSRALYLSLQPSFKIPRSRSLF